MIVSTIKGTPSLPPSLQSNPLDKAKPHEMYAEIAPGLGETLASGSVRGSPYRVLVDKNTGGGG